MVTLLFTIMCTIYIGLGIPDSALGASWPEMYKDLQISLGSQAYIAFIISLGTVTTSFFSAKLINKFGTPLMTACSTLLSALALLGFSLSTSLVWLCLLALPMGFSAGAIDAALNNYVAIHYKPKHMSFLHCFYGLGVALSPFVISWTISLASGWRLGYRNLFIIQFCLAVICFLTLPLWKKSERLEPEEKHFTPITLSFKELIKMPAARVGAMALFFATALEFTFNNWACTFLVESEGLSEEVAARLASLLFLGMMAGRLISGLVADKVSRKWVIGISFSLLIVGITIFILPLPPLVKGYSLVIVGLGNGPIFPNFVSGTPDFFGKEYSQSVMGLHLVGCNLGILLMPQLFGVIAQLLSPDLFPYFTGLLLCMCILLTVIYIKRLKKQGKTF